MVERRGLHLLLRGGVLASAGLLLLGLAGTWLGAAGEPLLRAGLAVLLATPVLRVAYLAWSCALARDWPFLGVSLSVLAMMAAGILLG